MQPSEMCEYQVTVWSLPREEPETRSNRTSCGTGDSRTGQQSTSQNECGTGLSSPRQPERTSYAGVVADAPAPSGQYNGLATIKAATCSACLEDAWQTIPTLSLTFGLPRDKPVFNNVPPLKCLDGVAPNGTVVPDAAISGPAAGAAELQEPEVLQIDEPKCLQYLAFLCRRMMRCVVM